MKEKTNKYQSKIPRSKDYLRVRVPTSVQMEAIECGAASLRSILAYYGKYVTLEKLRVDCGVTRDGASVLGIIRAAQKYGLLAEAVQVDLEDLYDLPLPLIAFWDLGHFVVIEGFSRDNVYIMDPGGGRMRITYEDLNSAFSGVAILFDMSIDFQKSGQPVSIIDSLVSVFKREYGAFIFAFLIGLSLVFPQLALPALGQIFIDNILSSHLYNFNEWFLISIVVILGLTLLMKYLELNILSRLYIKLTTVYSGEFLWHILRLPYMFYLQRYSGEIANRMQINENVYKTISLRLASLIIDTTVSIAFGIALFYYDTTIAYLSMLLVGIQMAFLRYLFVFRQDAYFYFLQTVSKSMAYSIGTLNNIETVKAAALDYSIFGQWAGFYTKSLNALQEIGKMDVFAGTIPFLISNLTLVMVLSLGGWKVIHGEMTVGMLFAILLLVGLFTNPISHLISFLQQVQFLKIDMERINDVLKNPIDKTLLEAEKNDAALLKDFTQAKLQGSLEVKDLTFGYNAVTDPVIKNFNLYLTPGSMVAIIGPTGCGKSTIAKLIAGLFEPWSGSILFDNLPRNQIPRSILLNSVGVVGQNALPFFGTVKDNISFFNPMIQPEEVVRAAKDACIHEEILSRKGGYDLYLHNNGSNLSGGERQRLEIARVLAMQPTILILDEATSALDNEVEFNVMKNIRRRGCTCVLVAHRISSTRFCDQVIILDRGGIVQQGFHEELIKVDGMYKKLYELEQMKNET